MFRKLRCAVNVATLGRPSQLPLIGAAPPFASVQPRQNHTVWRR